MFLACAGQIEVNARFREGQAKQAGPVTEQEYLRLEEMAKARHEYRNGRIIDMAGGTGGTGEHAGVAMNLGIEIGTRLKGGPCKVYGSDLSVRINQSGSYCYPDLMVVCGPLKYASPDRRTNPMAYG